MAIIYITKTLKMHTMFLNENKKKRTMLTKNVQAKPILLLLLQPNKPLLSIHNSNGFHDRLSFFSRSVHTIINPAAEIEHRTHHRIHKRHKRIHEHKKRSFPQPRRPISVAHSLHPVIKQPFHKRQP